MRGMSLSRIMAAAVCVVALSAARPTAAQTLDIYFIDVEGGQSTLIVSPSGESLLVDTLLRGDQQRLDASARSRASALGWPHEGGNVVIVGPLPEGGESTAAEGVRRAAHDLGLRALHSVHGDRLVVIVGGRGVDERTAERFVELFGDGTVVSGPVVDDLDAVPRSARAAFAGNGRK